MKPNVIRGIGRCCTRGFAWVEVVATVGQWADSGAWDYFVKYGLTHSVRNCLPASRDRLTVQTKKLPKASAVSDYSSANGKGKNKEAYL